MELRPGQKLNSAVCDAEVVVVKAPSGDVEIACGGASMLSEDQEADGGVTLDASLGEAVQLGKRYADDDLGLQPPCTCAGDGALTVNGELLHLKGAKPLPSSD